MRPWRRGTPHPFARVGLFATGEGFLHATRRQHTTMLIVDSLASYASGVLLGISFVIILGLLQAPGGIMLASFSVGVVLGGAAYGAISALARTIGCLFTKTSLRDLNSGAPIGVWALTWRMALLAVSWVLVLMAWVIFLRNQIELPFGPRFTRHVLVDLRRH